MPLMLLVNKKWAKSVTADQKLTQMVEAKCAKRLIENIKCKNSYRKMHKVIYK